MDANNYRRRGLFTRELTLLKFKQRLPGRVRIERVYTKHLVIQRRFQREPPLLQRRGSVGCNLRFDYYRGYFFSGIVDNDLGKRDRFDNNFAHKIRSNNPRACCGMFLREKERKGRICI